MKKIKKLILCAALLAPQLVFANFGLGVLGNYQETEYKTPSQKFTKFGGGISFTDEPTKQGFHFGMNYSLLLNTVSKATTSSGELSGFSQMEYMLSLLFEFNYRISRFAFFFSPGSQIKYATKGTLNGAEVTGSSRFGTGIVVGGGIKVFPVDSVFLKGTFLYEVFEFGADIGGVGSTRDFKSGLYAQFGAGYVFGTTSSNDSAKDPYAAPAPAATNADPYAAPAEEAKPAAGKKPAAKKKGK